MITRQLLKVVLPLALLLSVSISQAAVVAVYAPPEDPGIAVPGTEFGYAQSFTPTESGLLDLAGFYIFLNGDDPTPLTRDLTINVYSVTSGNPNWSLLGTSILDDAVITETPTLLSASFVPQNISLVQGQIYGISLFAMNNPGEVGAATGVGYASGTAYSNSGALWFPSSGLDLGFQVSVVPEASGMVILAMAAGACAVGRRRRTAGGC